MKINEHLKIKDLAQDFMKPPRFEKVLDSMNLYYDFETEDGSYGEKIIHFKGVKAFRYTLEEELCEFPIGASNSIGLVEDSEWLKRKSLEGIVKHFIIYFDGFGMYEFLAKDFEPPVVAKE